MNHFERLHCCLSGKNMQEIPVSFWRHFPMHDSYGPDFVKATLKWQSDYDFDFVKVMPPASFNLKDWGSRDAYTGNGLGIRRITHFPVSKPDHWIKLKELNPSSGYLHQHLKAVKAIIQACKNKVPVVHSVFNPVAQMINLCPPDVLCKHLTEEPQAVTEGLRTIAQSTANMVLCMAEMGLDGIFFIVKELDLHNQMHVEYFSNISKGFDLQCLEPAKNLWLNILHLHTSKPNPECFENYPVQVNSLHGLHEKEVLLQIKSNTRKVLCGGLQRFETMTSGTIQQVEEECDRFAQYNATGNYILGSECGLPINTPAKNINTAVAFARGRNHII